MSDKDETARKIESRNKLLKRLQAIRDRIPKESFKKLPPDLSQHVDYYLNRMIDPNYNPWEDTGPKPY